eukprot:scaffold556412_cov43-Prasinocladus_malaysianus.AAC.1
MALNSRSRAAACPAPPSDFPHSGSPKSRRRAQRRRMPSWCRLVPSSPTSQFRQPPESPCGRHHHRHEPGCSSPLAMRQQPEDARLGTTPHPLRSLYAFHARPNQRH